MIDREFGRGAAERARIRDRLHVAKIVPGEHGWRLRCCNRIEVRSPLVLHFSGECCGSRGALSACSVLPSPGGGGSATQRSAVGVGSEFVAPTRARHSLRSCRPSPSRGGCSTTDPVADASPLTMSVEPSLPRSRGAFRARALPSRTAAKSEGGAGRRGRVRTRGLAPLARRKRNDISRSDIVRFCSPQVRHFSSVPRAVFEALLCAAPGGRSFQASDPFECSTLGLQKPNHRCRALPKGAQHGALRTCYFHTRAFCECQSGSLST